MNPALRLFVVATVAIIASSAYAQSTSGTLSTTDPTFTHPGSVIPGSAGGPRHFEEIRFDVTAPGAYTFDYGTTGYQGAMYLYQNFFQAGSPTANYFGSGAVTGNPVSFTANLSVPGTYAIVLTSASNSQTGQWTLDITGGASVEMGPVVHACLPATGPDTGGTMVTISGDFLGNTTDIWFDATSAGSLTVVNPNTVTCTVPAHAAGAVDITVFTSVTAGTLQGVLAGGFTYTAAPVNVMSISRLNPSATETNAASVDFRVTFSAAVSGVSDSNFDVSVSGGISGAGVTSVSGSGTQWDVSVDTGSGDGTLQLQMINDNGTTPSVSALPHTTGESYTIDKTPPGISIGAPSVSSTTNGPVDWTVTYANADNVTLSSADVTLNTTGTANGSIAVTGSGTGSRTVTISGITGSGTLSVSVAADTASDTSGNTAGPGGPSAICAVIVLPTVTTPTSSATMLDTATAGADVTDDGGDTITARGIVYADTATNADPQLGGSGVTSMTASGTTGTFTVTLTGLTPGTQYSFKGYATNSVGTAYTSVDTFTTTALPTVVSIIRNGASPTAQASVSWTVTLSAGISGLAAGDFSLSTTGLAGTSITGLTGSGTTWVVTADLGTGDGTIRADLTGAAAVTPGIGNLPFTSGESYDVDRTAPTLTPVSAIQIVQGSTLAGATVGSVSDNLTAPGSLSVAATTLPTGIAVNNVSNVGGTISADIVTDNSAAPGIHVVGFTITDTAGNSATGNIQVDVTANTPPTITAPADQVIQINNGTGALTVTIDDPDEGPGALVLTADTDNGVLVNTATGFTIGGTGATRTIDVSPEANNIGVATITLTVTDSGGLSESASFVLTAEDAVNGPSISVIGNQVIERDTTSHPIAFSVDDPQGTGTLMLPAAVSGDASLVPPGGLVISGTAPSHTLTITPAAGLTGTTSITVSVSDGTVTFSRSFQLTVQDPSSGGGGGDDDDDEDCSTSTSDGWLMLLALLGTLIVGLRSHRSRA